MIVMKNDGVAVYWESIPQKATCVARSRALRILTLKKFFLFSLHDFVTSSESFLFQCPYLQN